MNNITYQPTGVYKQIAQNPALLNQSAGQNQGAQNQPVQKPKIPRAAKLGAIGILAVGAFAFGKYYKNGLDVIKTKEKTLKDITSAKSLEEFISKKMYSTEEKNAIRKLYADSEKYSKNIVGKLHKMLTSITGFFERNFYNY